MSTETTYNISADTRSLLTSSRLKAARSCRRLHHLRYDLGIEAATEASATRFGTLVHKGLEAWWRSMGDLDGATWFMRESAGPDTDAFEMVRAEVLLRGYHFRWAPDLVNYEVIAVEKQFECDLINPATGHRSQTWKLGGKLDALVRDVRDGRVLVVEHKTSSEDISQGSEYWRRLRMDGQVSVYYVGATSLGHEVSGCLYDVIGKPALRPAKATENPKRKKDGSLYANQREADETPEEFRARLIDHLAESPDRYYQRGNVYRLEAEVGEALLDIWHLSQELRAAELAGRFPRNPSACSQYGRTCHFFDACSGCASLDDAARFKRLSSVHPELLSE